MSSLLNELRHGPAWPAAQLLDSEQVVTDIFLRAALVNALNKIDSLENRLEAIDRKLKGK